MLWLVLYPTWIVSEIVIAILTRTRRDKGEVFDRGTMLLLWIVIVLSLTASGFSEHYFAPSFPRFFRTAASAILILGLAIRWFAVLSLGRAFSANVAVRESQQINQSGFYKFIRHPSYLGLLLIFLAAGLHTRRFAGLILACVPPAVALLYRIHVEEIALVSVFGNDYQAYISRTKRLLPWIY